MKYFLCFLSLTVMLPLSAETYYVRTDGSDQNSGKKNTSSEAWKSVDYAFSMIKAGDELLVNEGVYVTDELRLENLHSVKEKITMIKSIQPWGAKLTQKSSPEENTAVITVSNCSYLSIVGFEVYDSVDTGVGITVRDSSHHISVENCYVHDCGCNGISSRLSDYIRIENNVVRGNAKRNEWNCSGISIWHPLELDKKPGYHIIIRRNVAFENECDLPFRPLGYDNPTDGNGIIVDDFRNTQGGGQEGGYTSAVLVENNLSFNNGGRGFNVYQADNVTLRNNTSYHNLRIISKYADFPGEMTLSNSTGCRLYNNLIVKNPAVSTKSLRCYDNDSLNTKIYNNLIVGPVDLCGQELTYKENDVQKMSKQAYPLFRAASKNINFTSARDFRQHFGLQGKSPAINAGTADNAPEYDRDGVKRNLNKGADAGCYEWNLQLDGE